MRVLGLDPGSHKLGLAVLDGDGRTCRVVAYATERVPKGAIGSRLSHIFDVVEAWVREHGPQAAAVEEVFVKDNVRTALILGQARGAALLALARAGLEPHGYAPAQVKLGVAGHGRAGKAEMRQMVRLQLGLKTTPPEDAADALAVAMTHLFAVHSPQAAGLAW